jgi:hypothetical protein
VNMLTDQVALTTGSAGVIGAAITAAFADPAGSPRPPRSPAAGSKRPCAQNHPNRQPVKEA